MKILINGLSARLGGGQTYLINLLEHLPDRNDFEILVYAPDSLKLPIHAKIKRCTTRWPTTNPIMRAFWEKYILPGVLRKEAVDVLFCPGGTINTRPPHGCKTVTMFRNMIPFDMKVRKRLPLGLQRIRNWLLEHIMLKSMASADLTIFISDYARHVIEQRISVKNAVTIPHGINSSFKTYKVQLARPKIAHTEKYILYVSRFDIYKHHYEVVEAYASLPTELRQEYRLLLAGESDGDEANRVIDLIARSGLQHQVRILGPVPYRDLPALYHHASLVLFASSCENCPNILLEALGAGRPVLSSNVMPMPEFGGSGAGYFSPFDSEDIARKMTEVLTNPELTKVMSEAAATRSEKFVWAASAKETWERIIALEKLD